MKFLIESKDTIFDSKNTGIALYNNMLKKPDYFRDSKELVFRIEYMKPEQYRELVNEQQSSYHYTDFDNVNKIIEYVKAGNKLPMPVIEDSRLGHYQEGWHRSVVADKLGIKKIPVMIVRDA